MNLNPLGRRVRTVTHKGQLYFYLTDITALLHTKHEQRIVATLDPDEFTSLDKLTGNADDRTAFLVSEAAIFKFVLRMHNPFGRALLRWVAHDVLPEMRAKGAALLHSDSKTPQGPALVSFLQGFLADSFSSEVAAQ